VRLSAAASTTSWDSRLGDPKSFELPLLTLHEQQQATLADKRTLTLQISGLAAGTQVELLAVSWHNNPTTGEHHRMSEFLSLPERDCSIHDPCTLHWTWDAGAALSDFYRIVLRDEDGGVLWQNPDPERPDLVAVDTWQVDIDDYAVRISYAVLFPFSRGEQDVEHQLAPTDVHAFIGEQFVPIVVDTWQTQIGEWGFGPIHSDWDADGIVEIFFACPPFALADGIGTYTVSTYADDRPYPERRIWLRTDEELLGRYDSLESGFKVLFSHEFFHTVQWNVRLSGAAPANRWPNVIVEAQAIAAVTVQYPEIELAPDHLATSASQYGLAARRFLEQRMDASFADLEADETHRYDAALYWRFLYEQFGGMDVFRAALQEMTRRPTDTSTAALDRVMDAALARLEGPFETFEQSLVAFAQANYALRLENGRCTEEDLAACTGGYHDPHRMYTIPGREASIRYQGMAASYEGTISAGYGSHLVEIHLDQTLDGQALTIECLSEDTSLSLQVWKLRTDPLGARNPAQGLTGVFAQTPVSVRVEGDCRSGCRYEIADLDLESYDRLAVILVRLDANQDESGSGAYRLTVEPEA